jgi:hypothetical protein
VVLDGWEFQVRRLLGWPIYDSFKLEYWCWVSGADQLRQSKDSVPRVMPYRWSALVQNELVAIVENEDASSWQMSHSMIRLAKNEAAIRRRAARANEASR